MLVLSIDTSCDETAAAVVRDGRTILANVVSSQIKDHAEFGGVVPEIASRKHLEAMPLVIVDALAEAGVTIADIEGIAVTRGPGLVGALLVGISTAKAMAYARKIPLVGVNHIEGHLFASFLESPVEFPFLALVVSGGHSHLYRVDGVGQYRTLGQTIDDASGEAYDKVAKILGLPYPGGVVIDRLAASGDPSAVRLPRPLMHDGTYNFSFSGLKTAVLTHVNKQGGRLQETALNDLCASFQAAVSDVLTTKTMAAAEAAGLSRIVVSGGVACNSGLRKRMSVESAARGFHLHIPSQPLCTDNAAMIAVPGDYYLAQGLHSDLSLDSRVTWPLDAVAAEWGGLQ
jgi:N6-L-threonylcarbamoyladenine synthase